MSIRHPDWLAELQGLVALALTVQAGAVVFHIVTFASGGPVVAQVPVEAVTGVAGASGGLRAGAVVDGEVDVLVADPTPGQAAMYLLTTLPTLTLVAAVLALLWAALRRARRADPFTDGTVRRLRLIGWVAIVGGILTQAAQTVASLGLTARVTTDGGWSATLNLTRIVLFLLVGFGFLAIAEILKRGSAMRTELETVI
ncbi:DUF2975 domain-containing protein [Micromonospora sp. NPDC050397]|uniref:DUF2975 domain-containing protein n=1 Tax=Micromonospora sp. NPDC050397 TaxID=3364279 RepID=UPI00384D5191